MCLATIANKGFSLLEVLITLFILAVGLLGVSQLQIKAFHANQNAYFRSQASFVADGMFERMRANKVVAQRGEYQIDSETAAAALSDPDSIRTVDITQWKENITAILPEGKGEISCEPCDLNPIYDVEVRWKKFEQHSLISTGSYNRLHVFGAL